MTSQSQDVKDSRTAVPSSRFTKDKAFRLPRHIQEARAKAESHDNLLRMQGIDAIVADMSETAARVLLSLLHTSGWRSTKHYILLRLSRFMHYERVFFALAKLLEDTRDTQLCMWALDTFKYSRTNRYDTFLRSLLAKVDGKLKEYVFETLLHLASPLAHDVMAQLLTEHGAALPYGADPARAYRGLQSLPAYVQTAFLHYAGTFNLLEFKPLLLHYAHHPDPYLATCACLNLLKQGVSKAEWEGDLFDTSMEQLGPSTLVKDELIKLFSENQQLKRTVTCKGHIDQLFAQNPRDITNISILMLNLFDQADVLENLAGYQEECHYGLILRIVGLVRIEAALGRKMVYSYCCKAMDHRFLAQALSFLWSSPDADIVGLVATFFDRIEADLKDPSEVSVDPCLFFAHLRLPEKPKPIVNRCLRMIVENSICQVSVVAMINMLTLECVQNHANEKFRAAIEHFLNAALTHYMKGSWESHRGVVLRLCRAFGQIRYNSGVFHRFFRRIFFSPALSFSERNGMLWILAENKDNPGAHMTALAILSFAYKIRRYRRERVFLLPVGNSDSEEILLHCFATRQMALPAEALQQLVDNVDRDNWLALLQLIFHQPLPEAWPWLASLIADQARLSSIERLWLIRCLESYNAVEAIGFLAQCAGQGDEIHRQLAAYTLSRMNGMEAIVASLRVAKIAVTSRCDRAVVATIFQHLALPAVATEAIVAEVSAIVGQLKDEDLFNSATNYLTRLQTQGQTSQIHQINKSHSRLIEELIGRLKKQIVRFGDLSHSVQSVLLSAEIPLHHPELFDQSIDKSISILQYIKALDIYLNDKVGVVLQDAAVYRQLQNLVINTGLDRIVADFGKGQDLGKVIRVNDQVLRKLELTAHFEPKEFPIIKFSHIVSAIINNSLVQYDFKVIDGLKAWGILLFLMGRTFRGSFPKPITSIYEDASTSLIEVCKRMFVLQEYRNPIAHRQTIFEPLPVELAREKAFGILNDLQYMME
jgi:hypothetical protein